MLEPYTVLDLTDERGEIGPMLLGDLGADVIRIEPPGGTSARSKGPFLADASEDLHSLQFIAFNRNKRSIVLDPNSASDRQTLQQLIERADFIFTSSPVCTLAPYGLDFEAAKQINPRIIFTTISPFGTTGPYAEYAANDLVVAALGGPVALQGTINRAPVRLSVTQVWRHAGVEAAAGAMVALGQMLNCGEAQFVDVSAQSVMTWTMLNAMDAYAIQGYDFERAGSVVNTARMRAQIQHPTADGYVIGLPFSDIIRACLPGMIEEGIADQSITDIDWDEYDLNTFDPDAKPLNLAQGTDMCQRYFAPRNKQDLFEFGLREGVTLAPVNTLTELLDLEHIQFREYWRTLDLPDGTAVRAPGLWAKTSSNQLSVRREAPGLDADGDDIRRELSAPGASQTYPAANPEKELPFAGLKVADFAWVGVGPISAKYLADHGATVVRVESEGRPDVLRGNGPFKDDEPGLDRSQFFGDFNTSKRSFSLDLKSKEGLELARKLIAQSDVFIESFAPGAIERMGLTYQEVSELNPGLIMISTCLMGQTGPARALAGYGYHAAAIAGFYEVTGWPDMEPSGPWVAYTDTIAPRFVSTLLGAVLDHRRRTGEGCYVDLAQIETALHFLGPELLDLQANGTTYTRMGNRGRYAAPQGCYPCAGEDRWCAVSVDTDEQWQNLCREMGREDWANDANLATNAQRLGEQEQIDAGIADWSQNQEPVDLMRRLQSAGVPAGVVQRSSELLADPQYAHRNFYRYHEHPVMGKIPYAGHQYRISGYDNAPRAAAPTLGQHSFEVLSDLLGFSDEEIAAAYANGAVN